MTTYKGQSLKRFEDAPLIRGRGNYVDDMTLPGMLHAAVLRSVHAHASVVSIDVSAARNMPGVAAVLTADDIKGKIKDIPTMRRAGMEQTTAPDHPVLAGERVCYVGQPVAIAVAETRALAKDALDLIRVQYEPIAPVIDPMTAADATPIHADMGTNVSMRVSAGEGDVDGAFAQADHVVKGRFDVPRLAAVPMENRGLVVQHDATQDELTIWTSTQVPHRVKNYLGALLANPPKEIRAIAPDVGGGFGQKLDVWPEEVASAYLAITLGRPIKWIEDRVENMLASHGRGYTGDVEAAVTNDGRITGMRFRIVADLGAYFLSSTGGPPINAAHRVAGPYDVRNMDVQMLGVLTNKPPTGPYRGAGGPEAAMLIERAVDLIAIELGMDPVEVRKRNFIPPEAFPYTTATDLTYDSGDFVPALDKALELAEYAKYRKAQQSQDPQGPLLGIGVATVVKASGGGIQTRTSDAKVRIEPSGQVKIYTEVSPHGQGTETSFAQIAADVLGINPANVQVLHGDTEMIAQGFGTSASRGLAVGGSAVYMTLQEARAKLRAVAAHLLGCSVDNVTLGGDQARAKGKAIAFADVAAAAYDAAMLPKGIEPGLEFALTYTLPANPFGFAAHIAVVEVDRDTGNVALKKYVAVHDCGPMINPMIVEGQIHGGIVQGIGQAIGEGMVYTADGQPLTGTLLDYGVPMAIDLPNMDLGNIQTPSPTNPLGIKGIGELPTVAAPVAVANAVMDAIVDTGVRNIDVPLTPQKVWQALQAGKG